MRSHIQDASVVEPRNLLSHAYEVLVFIGEFGFRYHKTIHR